MPNLTELIITHGEELKVIRINQGGYSGFSGFSGVGGGGGTSGFSGYSGLSGYSAYSGFSGSGISGYSGFSGRSGYSGFSAYSGFCGASGFSGFSGIGGSGYSGFSGKSGYSGFSASSPGSSGYSGFCGQSGYSGFSGSAASASGYSGFSGKSGYSGFSAASPGASGYSGFCGLSGYSGFCGQSGYSGYSGVAGPTGATGASGTSGYSGFSGFSGPSGYSGFSAASPGASGYSGFCGLSGYSGYSATSGYSGFSGSGGATDPIEATLGTPDTAYEFDTSGTVGTAVGTATVEDWDTTVPDCYYVNKAATASAAITGRCVAASAPVTVVTKVIAGTMLEADFSILGMLFVAEASPGKLSILELSHDGANTVKVYVQLYTNPTTFSSNVTSTALRTFQIPVYYAIVATTTSSVAYFLSYDGYVWYRATTAHNPSFTIGSVGVAVNPGNASIKGIAAFEYIRIWNSAKTLITQQ